MTDTKNAALEPAANEPTPHSSWAEVYDLAYEKSYGEYYNNLTALTIQVIKGLNPTPCSVVDFGAGTGRLAIPLAQRDYQVTAVEPCKEMLAVLNSKAALANVSIRCHCRRMQDFDSTEKFDLALCLFTTVLYLLDEDALRAGLSKFANALKLGGKLLFDIPTRQLFRTGGTIPKTGFKRTVTITPNGVDLYTYHELIRLQVEDGTWKSYEDTFPIRYWPEEIIFKILKENGIDVDTHPIPGFGSSGSNYYKGTKR